jgi:hypothetical protein
MLLMQLYGGFMFRKLLSQSRHVSFIRSAIALTIASAALAIAPNASANLLSWSFTGPGTTSTTQVGNLTTLDYLLSGPEVHTTQSWVATAIAGDAGDYAFNWNYSGDHAFFEASAFLNAISPSLGTDNLVSASTFGLFDFIGSYTFSDVNVGDALQFVFGGRNNDSTEVLVGALTLDQQSNLSSQGNVPEPTTIALLGLGVLGLTAARRKSAKR